MEGYQFEEGSFQFFSNLISNFKQLEEAHRQLSIATSMPETAEKTYLILIDNYKQELETWFLDESDNEQHYMRLYKGMEVLRHEIMNCNDAVEVMELFDNFKSKFAEINKDTELVRFFTLKIVITIFRKKHMESNGMGSKEKHAN
jgi:hypothetical protein